MLRRSFTKLSLQFEPHYSRATGASVSREDGFFMVETNPLPLPACSAFVHGGIGRDMVTDFGDTSVHSQGQCRCQRMPSAACRPAKHGWRHLRLVVEGIARPPLLQIFHRNHRILGRDVHWTVYILLRASLPPPPHRSYTCRLMEWEVSEVVDIFAGRRTCCSTSTNPACRTSGGWRWSLPTRWPTW